MTGTPFVFSNHTHFSHPLRPSHVLLTATFALSYCHTLSSLSVPPFTPVHAFFLPSRQLLQSPGDMWWSFEGRKTWKGGKVSLQMKWAVDTRLSTPRGSSVASLALEGFRIPKVHSLHSAVANLTFFHDEQPSSLCFQLTLIFLSVSLVTFGVISLCIYPSGIFRKDKFAESHLLLTAVRGMNALLVSQILRDNPWKSGMDPLHKAEGPLPGIRWGPQCGIEQQRNSIGSYSNPWILFALMEQMELGKRGKERIVERIVRLMSQSKVFGLIPFSTPCKLFDLGQVT